MTKKKVLIIYYSVNDGLSSSVFNGLKNLFDEDDGFKVHKINYFDYVQCNNKSDIESLVLDADIVYLHFSVLYLRVYQNYNYNYSFLDVLRRASAVKIAIPQDEGNCPSILDELFTYWKIDLIFSVHYSENSPLYPLSRNFSLIKNVLPVFIPDSWLDYSSEIKPKLTERPIDIGYRGRPISFNYGTANYYKSEVPLKFKKLVSNISKEKINCDISVSQHDRLYGNDWYAFLTSCKTVFGCEGGYTAIDFSGRVAELSKVILQKKPDISREKFDLRMPQGWDNYELLTITSRHFEAAYTGTSQILIEGKYKGLLSPDKHYIPLKADLSNIDEVLEKIEDISFLERLNLNLRSDLFVYDFTYGAFLEKIKSSLKELDFQAIKPSAINLSNNTLQALTIRVESDFEMKISIDKEKKQIVSAKKKFTFEYLFLFLKRKLYNSNSSIRRIIYRSYYLIRRIIYRSYYLLRRILIKVAHHLMKRFKL